MSADGARPVEPSTDLSRRPSIAFGETPSTQPAPSLSMSVHRPLAAACKDRWRAPAVHPGLSIASAATGAHVGLGSPELRRQVLEQPSDFVATFAPLANSQIPILFMIVGGRQAESFNRKLNEPITDRLLTIVLV
jgi:hypothetical protein